MTAWFPIALPGDYTPQKARVHGDSVVVLAASATAQSALFVRKRGSTALRIAIIPPSASIKDFVAFSDLGVFVLTAAMAGRDGNLTSWDDLQVLELNLDTCAIRTVYSSDDWDRRQVSFPISFLGSTPDRRLVLACGQHVAPGESALDYRVGYLDPVSGQLELAEQLAGLVF